MASIVSELLFNGTGKRDDARGGESTDGVRNGFDRTCSPTSGVAARPRVHPGPPPVLPPRSDNPFSSCTHARFAANEPRDLIRWNVVSEKDAQRGFRMFDGILMSVRDVSSEELFLERMRIAYAAYDAHVAALVDGSPSDVTEALVRAVSACITGYFSTQSMLRTNRPFIAKVLHLDSPDMFCARSDFVQSFVFTNASAEDEAIIALAEKVYAENDFDVCERFEDRRRSDVGTDESVTESDRLFELGTRIAENSVVGGTRPSFGVRVRRPVSTAFDDPYALGDDGLPFTPRGNTDRGPDTTTAMLIVVTDFEALQSYVSYALYLTPMKLSKRYTVNFDPLRRQRSVNLECSRSREARNARKRDSAKAAIRAVVEKKRLEKIDGMGERSEACDSVLRERARQRIERNNDVLRHVLLMLFDKCLSALIDRGFENLNARRGYAVNSAKEIGTATVYTGIIETVGEISTYLEGRTFENVADTGPSETVPRVSSPLDAVGTEDARRSTGRGAGTVGADRVEENMTF